ncbi:MAG: FtsX-like permease family protein [Anaerolineaceae bacterium]|nr:FtsX-like permease family protein [Anaerolineaceae bacterium]
MSVIWRKVWFDLWHNKGRTSLAILSIAAGVFAVGAIFGMVDQLLTRMDKAHQEVSPSHINIILRTGISEEVVDNLKEITGIIDIDPVNQISIRYKIDPDDAWELGTLVQRSNYDVQTYDIVVLKEGNWPSQGKIGIERLSSQYFGPEISDSVIFQVQGKEKELEINGLIRHPFVQPPPFGGQAHFFTDSAGLEEFGIPSGYYGQLLVQVEPYSLEYSQQIAGEIRSQLANKGYGVLVSLYQEPDRHWGRMFVEGITLVLQIMAVVSLFMSIVLVLNTFTALITQQTDQIGIIKSIGGRRATIIRVYLSGVLIYGFLALLIALPSSSAFSYFMSRWFLNLFNIDYPVFQVSQRAILFQIGSALLAPMLAALWPVLKGAGISVREAISTYGLGGDFGNSKVDRLVDRVGSRFLSTIYAASLGNLFRRKGRLVLTLLVLTTAGIMFLVIMALIASTNLTLDNEMARQGYDVRIGFTNNQDISSVLKITNQAPGVQSTEMWYSRNATILRSGERLQDSAGLGAQLLGIPSETKMYKPIIVTGRWLEPNDERVIVISQETADKNRISVGDNVTLDLGELGAVEWEVIGLYRVIYGSGFVVEPIYAPLAAVHSSTNQDGQGSQVLVKGEIANLDEETKFSEDLKTRYEEAGYAIDFYTTTARLDQRVYADNQFASLISMLLSLAMLTATVGGIGLAGSLGISVVERTREIGVLRSIGARSATIMKMFIMEGIIQGIISFMIATPLAFILAQPLARSLGRTMLEVDLDFAFHYPSLGIWLITIIVIAILASIAPAKRATQISVREALIYT